MRRRVSAWLIATTLSIGFAGAASPRTYPVQLSARDRNLVAQVACDSIGAAGLDQLRAFKRRQGSRVIEVAARCTPHRTEQSLPVAHYTTCTNRSGAWRCADGHDAAQMRMADNTVVAIRGVGVELGTAIELIREAQQLVYPPFHTPARFLLRGTCSVTRKPDEYSANFERYGVDCDAGSFAISKVCPGAKCGYFITAGTRKDG
jgi:hypothetical protein